MTNLRERVYSKTKSIHTRMSKMKRKTFVSSEKKTSVGDKKIKVAEIEQAALKSVITLVDKSGVTSLEGLLNHRVTDENIL